MVRRLLATHDDGAPFLARLVLAAVMFPHGAQHALGWFGGFGFGPTLDWMSGTLGFPVWAAAVAIAVELVAPIALVFGLGGRLAALGVAGLMAGAASTHVGNGFFMNWFGALPSGSEGYEYHILAGGLALVVVLRGSGAWSLDGWLAGRDVARRGADETIPDLADIADDRRIRLPGAGAEADRAGVV
jgi:putative oxidoreductase